MLEQVEVGMACVQVPWLLARLSLRGNLGLQVLAGTAEHGMSNMHGERLKASVEKLP